MALATTLMAVGIPAEQANRLGYEDRVPLDGNGTTQGTATEIIATNTNIATGTSVGDTAFILPADAEYFQPYFVLNTTAEPALIFPPVGDTIDDNAVDVAIEIETDLARVFQRVEEGRWVSQSTGSGGGSGDVVSVVAGTGIAVDSTDPANPVVSNTGVLSVASGAGVSVDVTDPQNPIVINTGVLSVTAGSNITIGGTAQNPTISASVPPGGVESVVAGTGIDVDATDPNNPVVSNDGVLGVTAGAHITLGGTAQNPTINVNGDAGFSIVDFGAVVDGVTDDSAAILAMDAALAYVRFPEGVALIGADVTLADGSLVFFDPGASVDVAATFTFAINGEITAPRQQIFAGAGDILLDEDGSHHVKPEWFGAFPNLFGGDVGPNFQKMFDSVVVGRELVVDPGVGTYVVNSQITTSRAANIRGVGNRACHMQCGAALDGLDVITSGEQGVHIADFQFSAVSTRTGGAYIRFNHTYCEARRIWYTDGFVGVDVRSNGCIVEEVTGFLNATGAGSCLVAVRDGVFIGSVDLIRFFGSGPPQYIVRIEGAEEVTVKNVYGESGTALVAVVPVAAGSSKVVIDKVVARSGTHAVLVSVSAAVTAAHINIGNVVVDNAVTNGVSVIVSTGTARDILIDGVNVENLAGAGVLLTRTSGSLDDVKISGNCNLDRAATAISLNNTPTNIRIDPLARGNNAQIPILYNPTVADDAVFSLDFGKDIFLSYVKVSCNTGDFGMWLGRAAGSPSLITMITPTANIATTTGPLTGTTGADGKLTVSVDTAGRYYFENRLGASRPMLIELGLVT